MEPSGPAASSHDVTVDPRAIHATAGAVPLVAMTAVLWAHIVSIYVYKTWYVAAAMAMVVIALLAAARAIRTGGLLRASVPVLVYFGVLLASASWAEYPRDTLWWLGTDSIGIAVFVLAFLSARNATPGAVSAALTTLVVPGVAITAIMYARDPGATRFGQYAVGLLPFVAPLMYWRIVYRRPRWPVVVALIAAFAVLVFGRSRTPLAMAIVVTLLAVFVFRRNVRTAIRDAVVCAAVTVITIAALLLVPATRLPVVTMFVRITGVGVTWGGFEVPPEPKNVQRAALTELSLSLLPERMPLGIGYMNFPRYFEAVNGYPYPLHNIYMTWALEGGVACVAAVLFLAWRHVRSLRLGARRARAGEERAYVQACAISSVGLLGVGAFHQVHQSPAFWLLLGLAAAWGTQALPARERDEPEDEAGTARLMEGWRRSDPPFAPALTEPLMRTALRHLSQCPPGAVVADVGCGYGFMLAVFRDGGYRAVGLDADALATAHAAGPILAADGEQLPLRSNAVDGLFVFSAFQYMDRARALEECRRVLRPGGRFAVVENLAGNPVAALSRAMRRLRGARYPRHMEPRQHLRWADRSIYERHFSEVTYEVHHVLSPLFLFSEALEAGAAPSRKNRAVLAALRVVQRLERRMLAGGILRGAAWHLVVHGRK